MGGKHLPGRAALVLSGGGSRGAYQAGCWAALHEAGFQPDLIVGTSAGALNGALICAGASPAEMRHWWTSLGQRDVLRWRRDLWRLRAWDGLGDTSPLRHLLEEHLDLDALRAAPVDLLVTAVDLEAGREVVFTKHDLAVDHFLASAALLPGLPPVPIGGRLHADGGHWGALPLRPALEAGATRIHALLHDPLEPHPEPAPRGVRDLMRRASDVVWHGRQAAELEALRLRTRLPRKDPARLAPFDLTVHAPDPPLRNEILRFDRALAAELYDRGERETRGRLAA